MHFKKPVVWVCLCSGGSLYWIGQYRIDSNLSVTINHSFPKTILSNAWFTIKTLNCLNADKKIIFVVTI